MHNKLQWNAISFEDKTRTLQEEVYKIKASTPKSHTRHHKKYERFLDELSHLLNRIETIKKSIIPKLEEKFRVEFKTPELVMIALSRPSIRNIFEDLKEFFKGESYDPLNDDAYLNLASIGDAGEVLALLGDSVLDLATVQVCWDSSLAKAGSLTKKRTDIVSNKNLAKTCDKWGLWECRLNRKHNPSKKKAKKDKIEHEKGTLVEAIYGIIYFEFGLETVFRTVGHIQ